MRALDGVKLNYADGEAPKTVEDLRTLGVVTSEPPTVPSGFPTLVRPEVLIEIYQPRSVMYSGSQHFSSHSTLGRAARAHIGGVGGGRGAGGL